jgi:hypothetical protein
MAACMGRSEGEPANFAAITQAFSESSRVEAEFGNAPSLSPAVPFLIFLLFRISTRQHEYIPCPKKGYDKT